MAVRQYDPQKTNIWQLPYGIGIDRADNGWCETRQPLSVVICLKPGNVLGFVRFSFYHTRSRRAQLLMAKGRQITPISTGMVMDIQGSQTPLPKMWNMFMRKMSVG